MSLAVQLRTSPEQWPMWTAQQLGGFVAERAGSMRRMGGAGVELTFRRFGRAAWRFWRRWAQSDGRLAKWFLNYSYNKPSSAIYFHNPKDDKWKCHSLCIGWQATIPYMECLAWLLVNRSVPILDFRVVRDMGVELPLMMNLCHQP